MRDNAFSAPMAANWLSNFTMNSFNGVATQEARTLGTSILLATGYPEPSGAELLRSGARHEMGDGYYGDTTQEGKLFLCVVLDLFSKLIVGWSMHHKQDRQMVIRAVEMAVWQRQGKVPVILHSDRGSQFTSGDYQRYLGSNRLVSSMNAVGHVAITGPVRGSSKCSSVSELTTGATALQNEARADVFDYVDRFHNPRMRRRVAAQDRKLSAVLKPSVEKG